MFIRCPAIGPSLAVQSRLIWHTNWSPFTLGFPTEALWTVVPLANFSADCNTLAFPSVIRAHPGPSIASTCRALSAYSSLMASRFFPEETSSTSRLATFCVAWCSGDGGGISNDGFVLLLLVVVMPQAYHARSRTE